jgi:hypothetical protein
MKSLGILLFVLLISLHSMAQFEAKNWVCNSNLFIEFSEDSLVIF